MLNSAENEICSADKKLYTIIDNLNFFLHCRNGHEILPANKYENANNCWHFNIYYQKKFHAQLS